MSWSIAIDRWVGHPGDFLLCSFSSYAIGEDLHGDAGNNLQVKSYVSWFANLVDSEPHSGYQWESCSGVIRYICIANTRYLAWPDNVMFILSILFNIPLDYINPMGEIKCIHRTITYKILLEYKIGLYSSAGLILQVPPFFFFLFLQNYCRVHRVLKRFRWCKWGQRGPKGPEMSIGAKYKTYFLIFYGLNISHFLGSWSFS